MRNRETIAGLLTRVQAATGHDPFLDRDILLALGSLRLDDQGKVYRPCGETRVYGSLGDAVVAPWVTGSIDAAVALVERTLPGWDLDLNVNGLGRSGLSFAQLRGPDWSDHDPRQYADNGSTPMPAPLAILAALLAALRDAPSTESGGEPGRDPYQDTGSRPADQTPAGSDASGASIPRAEPLSALLCAARNEKAGTHDRADCSWPICGCDPRANKVIEALQINGSLILPFTPNYRHVKSGGLYQTLDIAINATNVQNGQRMMLYRDRHVHYVRERSEFSDGRFERLDGYRVWPASGTEARQGEDGKAGFVHEGPVGAAETPLHPDPNPRSDPETAGGAMRKDKP